MLGDELRRAKLCKIARFALRNYVPVDEMKAQATGDLRVDPPPIGGLANGAASPLLRTNQFSQAVRFNKFASLSYITGKFQLSNLQKMLRDIGVCVESKDVPIIFYHFDVNIDGFIDRDEFIKVLALTGYELDLAMENMKALLTVKVLYNSNRSSILCIIFI
jgi:Ca2+-binding EF-hand superfamily protein